MTKFEDAVSEYMEQDAARYEAECTKAEEDATQYFSSIEERWKAEALEKAIVELQNSENLEDIVQEISEVVLAEAKTAINEKFEREKQTYVSEAIMRVHPPVDREQVESLYSFLREPDMAVEDTSPKLVNFHELVYQIGDRYYSVPEHKFIEEPEDKTNVVSLDFDPTEVNLRKTLDFYRNTSQSWIKIGDALLTPKELYARKKAGINSDTSKAIIKGFDYEINGELLHFSYDTHDQQNFADTANLCVVSPPAVIVWKAYRHSSGELVNLELSVDAFLALYVNGALSHKNECLGVCQAEKAALDQEYH